jgi:isoleucyl-tRNA synthetase
VFKPIPSRIDFPAQEREVLAFWKEQRIFERSLELRRDAPRYVFFEGPPTANGTPHNGHVLTRVVKDLFPRYKTMRGFRVDRKAGWDTHGLPVEVEVEKELGIHGKSDIEAYGVEAFTKRCIESVFRYTDVWEALTERIGFWVDLAQAYVTFHQGYVESVWWALSTLLKKGLLYQGHKVVWWWPQGGTALSSGEVGLGYKTVDDPSITVKFRVRGEPGTSLLGWTTTPWTLPSNCALAVRADLEYCWARQGQETFIVARPLADQVLGEGTYEVVKTAPGQDLAGLCYEPVFAYAVPSSGRHHEVICADFVEVAATGIVHTAPAFGEDDYRAAKEQGIGILQLVGPDGRFLPEVTDFAGRFCKEADRDIIRHLRVRGLLYKEEVLRHDYPYCWRADQDPLIQYARPAWFIRTTAVIQRAIANNQAIHWYPEHIRDGRFGDFLAHNVDWALSRERYWGTPLNIWVCPDCQRKLAPASVAEIEALSPGAFRAFEALREADPTLNPHLKVHKPWIDGVTLPCDCGGTMRRVPEVIDCWFDSGCMPFAQWGWPHRGEAEFRASWPADFISEAIDQTRGWFYSLLMISTLCFEETDPPHPFRHCIVLGHVCDKTGKKESKSKGNYTAPEKILGTDGADAMRWYFYAANPPHSNTRYSPEAVRQGQQDVLVKLHNVLFFFVTYGNIDGFDARSSPWRPVAERGGLDRWMLSELALSVREVTEYLDDYGVYEAAQRLVRLVDGLSNWYVRRGRDRFWKAGQTQDKWDAYHTLYQVLETVARLLGPFIPFLTEQIYRTLVAEPLPDAPPSVHLTDWPEVREAEIDLGLSEEMALVREVVSLGLGARASAKLRVRQPLTRAEVILGRPDLVPRIQAYRDLIAEELNVKEVVLTPDAQRRVRFQVKPNYRALGPIFGSRMPLVRQALDLANPEAVRSALARGAYELLLADGQVVKLGPAEVQVTAEALEGFAASAGAAGVVVVDTRLSKALIEEGTAREVVSKIQAMRKERDLAYTARIAVRLGGDPELLVACRAWSEMIAREVLAHQVATESEAPRESFEAAFEVDGAPLWVSLGVVA